MGKRLVLYALGLMLLSIGSFYLLHIHEKATLERAQDNLTLVAQEHAKSLNAYFDQHEQKLMKLASDKVTQDTFMSYEKDKEKILDEKFRKFLERAVEDSFYSQLFLVKVDGDVIFSQHKGVELHQNLRTGKLSDSALGQSYFRTVMGLSPDSSGTSYYPVTQKPALFISVPVFRQAALLGVLTVQLPYSDIFSLVENYKNLGTTGEIVLSEDTTQGIDFASNIRYSIEESRSNEKNDNESKELLRIGRTVLGQRIPFSYSYSNILIKAALGTQYKGPGWDYRGHYVLATSKYIPKPDWGMTVKMDVEEILAPLYYWKLLVYALIFISIVLLLYVFMALILQFLKVQTLFRSSIVTLLVLSVGFLTYTTSLYYSTIKNAFNNAFGEARVQLNDVSAKIEHESEQIEYRASTLANNLTTEYLVKRNIPIRIKRDLSEHPNITGIIIAYAPYAYDKNVRLYAPYGVKENGKYTVKNLAQLYDYTVSYPQDPTKSAWYLEALKGKSVWIDSEHGQFIPEESALYAVPFYKDRAKKEIQGVVAIVYKISDVKKLVSSLSIGKTSYGFLLSSENEFLQHPVKEYSTAKKDLEKAQKTEGDVFEQLIQIGSVQEGTIESIRKGIEGKSWLLFKKLSLTRWTLGLLFHETDVALDLKKLYNLKLLIVSLVLLVAVLLSFFIFSFFALSIYTYSLASSVLLACSLSLLWFIISRNALTLEAQPFIVNALSLHKFTDGLETMTQGQQGVPPLFIETGIFITALTALSDQKISFTGHIWQKYRIPEHNEIIREIRLPQAPKATITQLYRQKFKDYEIVGWAVSGELSQSILTAERYPFDIKHIEIILEHPDITRPIVLIPDVQSYATLNPDALPGVDRQVRLLGFTLNKSFFSYKSRPDKAAFGLEGTSERLYPYLTFKVLAKRGLLNALIMYIFPLIVILIALFAALWILDYFSDTFERSSTPVFSTFSIYTALFFSLILIHRALRADLPTGDIIYIEYFFFFTYITILLLQLSITFLLASGVATRLKHIDPIKLYYWPLQLSLWIVTTLAFFYAS